MTTPGDRVHELAQMVRAVRSAVAEIDFPLPLSTAAAATAAAAAVRRQIDDYLQPRLGQLTAPLLVVVGGSTGAGKSTLVNSLVRAPVSAAGVLRPTTRAPVLVCHPADAGWFRGDHLLSGLTRTSGSASRPDQLQLIVAPALPPGLAFLDAPDIDSVVADNRELAHRLFGAADLWLFVTTPNRYADAVPWQSLHAARARSAVVALVLGRVPEATNAELVALLSELLTQQGLSQLPVFIVPETRVDRQGLLPEAATARLGSWFDALAADAAARASVVRCTLDGALAALPAQLIALAAAQEEQAAAGERLAEQVGLAYGLARGTIERGLRTGALGDEQPAASDQARHRQTPGEAELVKLVSSALADATEQLESGWRGTPAGAALLAGGVPGQAAEVLRHLRRAIRERSADGLLPRIEELLDAEAARWLDRLVGVPPTAKCGQRLRELAAELEQARLAANLPAPETPAVTEPSPEAVAPAEPSPAAAPAEPSPAAAPAEASPEAVAPAGPAKRAGKPSNRKLQSPNRAADRQPATSQAASSAASTAVPTSPDRPAEPEAGR